jgi:hypothetical protein
MDLKQRKLTKSEWDSIEILVSSEEQDILRLITSGYFNVNIKYNKTDSIFTYLKIEYNENIEKYIYSKFFAEKIKNIVDKYKISFIIYSSSSKKIKLNEEDNKNYYVNVDAIVKLKSSDQIRMSRLNVDITNNNIYEFVLLENLEQMIKYKYLNKSKWMYYYYTLNKLIKNNIDKINKYLKEIVETFIKNYEEDVDILYIIKHSSEYIEKNPNILKYNDLTLYDHQKEIFTIIKNPEPKLVLYIAPTGTGKTLTPLGISENYKVIFVCAARHVGLALAKSAISINKRIAFAFGCSSAEDVRLHYFSAKEYTKDRRSGQIRKVDNTVGDKVEIIICDIRSYLPAMFYMASFNPVETIVTYWDEPTITMDKEDHELHQIIKKNWSNNIIPNFVLSSATLPKMYELTQTISDFKEKFINSEIYNIVSNDCRKTIPLINNNGFIVMPHYLHENYSDILEVVAHCEDNLTLLRYLDLKEISNFIYYVETNNFYKSSAKFTRNFTSVDDIDMTSVKLYYLKLLKNIIPANWITIYNYFKLSRTEKISQNNTVDLKGNIISKTTSLDRVSSSKPLCRTNSTIINTPPEPLNNSGIYITTKDAYTLKDGPTIFLADNLQKIAKFCIQQANIPSVVMKDIVDKIEYNNQINIKIDEIEKELEFEELKIASKLSSGSADNSKEAKKMMGKKDGKKSSKIANKIVNKAEDGKLLIMRENITTLKTMVKNITLDDMFIPNKLAHLDKWAKNLNTTGAFTSDIDENTIVSIMLLKDVDDSWKILLLLGIGVFTEHKSSAYTEIMKQLTNQQKLYLIIADSDYIYGTNYQFCHGYLSKDIVLTQEKIIQALGRIGRNNIQQEYSARFRDDTQVTTLFKRIASEDKLEVINMNKLFNCKNVKWNGVEYEELPEEKAA